MSDHHSTATLFIPLKVVNLIAHQLIKSFPVFHGPLRIIRVHKYSANEPYPQAPRPRSLSNTLFLLHVSPPSSG